MKFEFKKLESTASPLYEARAIENNVSVMVWNIACDDETQLEALAIEAYRDATKPNDY